MTEAAVEQPAATDAPTPRSGGSGLAAALIAAGILLSRLLGLVRQMFMARYLGAGMAADAFNAAFKIPNILQNIMGEGALSASLIPVYASLLGRGEREEADRVAGAVAGLLALASTVFVVAGVLLTPMLIALIAPGFEGEKRALTIHLTRILFPGAGIFVLSAWCIGILNSHRKFFLSYAAPVAWNVAMIAALLWFGPRETVPRIAVALAWASVAGAALQFGVQLPTVLRLLGGLRVTLSTTSANVRRVMKNFAPVAVSRGVVQISSYVDQIIASWLPNGAVAMIAYASTLYVLPVSLFGMSVSAAELPELARGVAPGDEALGAIRDRVNTGLRRIAYFVVPSAVAFLLLGDVIVNALLRSGRFGEVESLFTWGILAGSAVGLLASTLARLYSSTFYAFHDTRTPFRFAVARIILGTALGVAAALLGPRLLGVDPRWGAAGLTLASSVAGWFELTLLRRGIDRRLAGWTGIPGGISLRLWGSAALAAAAANGVQLLVADLHRWAVAVIVLGTFGAVYLALTVMAGVPEARGLVRRVAGRLRR
ncbi:MAG TPA: murein biosynthesis integral membrane protein MurJ [Gemmatimonadaceae bacterium]|nr:murein biosynthesis integral membrane protein MurJ [Gemmatimonadaceae bacterium]